MLPPRSRGPLSQLVLDALDTGDAAPLAGLAARTPDDPTALLQDADTQLALWVLYELHYRGFDGVDPALEWHPGLIGARVELEARFEAAVRTITGPVEAAAGSDGLAAQLLRIADQAGGPSVASYLHRHATRDEMADFLRERSVYHLKESDPHSLVLARLDGGPKAALAELLYDEYGGGRPERLHASMYAETLAACGLSTEYGAYVDQVSGTTLAVNNLMSLFCLNRRLRGAAMGHLAAFEATSSVPCRRIAAGMDRLGLPPVAASYFDEHVEADAVHEQVAVSDICAALAAQDETLAPDIVFGVAACLALDVLAAEDLLGRWDAAVAA